MQNVWTRATLGALFVLAASAAPALAIPVQAPFGTDTFPRAIHFTGAGKPTSGSYGSGALGSVYRGSGGTQDSGIIMSPVGDGSYVCTAAVFPGAQYTYYFGFRNREFEPDTTTSWLTNTAPGERDQDVNRARTITVPTTASHGYIFYNAYGDKTVVGYQGPDTSVINNANRFLTMFGGNTLLAGLNAGDTFTRVAGDDTIFANMDASNTYSMDAIQSGDSAVTLTWSFSIGGSELFVPSVQGARRFSTTNTAQQLGSSPQYGFRIWRADSIAARPITGTTGAYFQDVTRSVTGGDTNWSDNDNNPWNGQTFVDTSLPDTATTFLYLVTFHTAYGYTQTDTGRQTTFSGGYDTITRSPAIRVFFIVEHFDENVVFPNGATHGQVYVTPVIDGVRRPDLRQPTQAVIVRRQSATI